MCLPDLRIRNERVDPKLESFDLARLLYLGGASERAEKVALLIKLGQLGQPRMDRLDLLVAVKEELETDLIKGESLRTVSNRISGLQMFIKFIDQSQQDCLLKNLETRFLDYAEYLFHRSYRRSPDLKKQSAYDIAAVLAGLLNKVLDIPKSVSLISRTRLKNTSWAQRAVGRTADKQNLEDTFQLGQFLIDVVDGLTIKSIRGRLPLTIPIREGLVDGNEVKLIPNVVRDVPQSTFYSPRRVLGHSSCSAGADDFLGANWYEQEASHEFEARAFQIPAEWRGLDRSSL